MGILKHPGRTGGIGHIDDIQATRPHVHQCVLARGRHHNLLDRIALDLVSADRAQRRLALTVPYRHPALSFGNVHAIVKSLHVHGEAFGRVLCELVDLGPKLDGVKSGHPGSHQGHVARHRHAVHLPRGLVDAISRIRFRLAGRGDGRCPVGLGFRSARQSRGGNRVQVGPCPGNVNVVVGKGQSGSRAALVAAFHVGKLPMSHETRRLEIGDIDHEQAVVRVGHEGVTAGHLHAPHVHADAVEEGHLDSGNEHGLGRLGDVEDLQPVTAAEPRVALLPPRARSRVVARGHVAVVAVKVDAVAEPVQGGLGDDGGLAGIAHVADDQLARAPNACVEISVPGRHRLCLAGPHRAQVDGVVGIRHVDQLDAARAAGHERHVAGDGNPGGQLDRIVVTQQNGLLPARNVDDVQPVFPGRDVGHAVLHRDLPDQAQPGKLAHDPGRAGRRDVGHVERPSADHVERVLHHGGVHHGPHAQLADDRELPAVAVFGVSAAGRIVTERRVLGRVCPEGRNQHAQQYHGCRRRR